MFDDNIGNPAYVLQLVLTGVVNGSLYAFAALAFVMAYRASSHINLAATELASLGAFVVLALTGLGLPPWIAIVLGLGVSFLMGAAVERLLIRPAEKRSEFAVILTTVALILIVGSLTGIVWGTDVLPGLAPFGDGRGVIAEGPPRVSISAAHLGVLVSLAVVVTGLLLLMRRTSLGLAFRALMSNRESSALVGISPTRLAVIGWGIAGVIGTAGAVLVSASIGTIDFMMMVPLLIYGIAAATLGGFDSIVGAVVGGIAVGLLVNTVPGLLSFIPGEMGFVVALAVILVVLLVRPQGLFGYVRSERV
ncbi:branched-chain amino acid ABC transporter permease [Microbacterium sp. 18062]|uniref:branched-chain amino acid ABC transporter permease n=1 Tax=Microbacterium sp. 18062 TaxID=2681410 RepID=UPI00135B89E7|nr:branched-chain amino acid ABC transporter permease [Microbacterium sp. 18062]